MSLQVLLAFIAACILLGLTPGPNMALIMANTLTHGLRSGLTTLAGTTSGLAVLVGGAAAGMGSMMVLMSTWFDIVRWGGAVYLAVLGARQLWRFWHPLRTDALPPVPASRGSTYLQGLLVSLSNPKVILFLGAFLPQFIDPAGNLVQQLIVLSVLFVIVLVAVDIAYTLATARLRVSFTAARLRLFDGVAGMMLLAGGAALAMMRRP